MVWSIDNSFGLGNAQRPSLCWYVYTHIGFRTSSATWELYKLHEDRSGAFTMALDGSRVAWCQMLFRGFRRLVLWRYLLGNLLDGKYSLPRYKLDRRLCSKIKIRGAPSKTRICWWWRVSLIFNNVFVILIDLACISILFCSYQIMLDCWALLPSQRPKCDEIVSRCRQISYSTSNIIYVWTPWHTGHCGKS